MTEMEHRSLVGMDTALSVNNLKTYFITLDGVAKVIPRLTFTLKRREILGILGEDRSGKSVISLSLVDLLREPGYVVGGSVFVNGFNLFREVKSLIRVEAAISSGKAKRTGEWKLRQHEDLMRSIRGKVISLVPENAQGTLNPLIRIEDQFLQAMLTQNLPEICTSIVQRETVNESDLTALIDLVSQQPDLPGRRRILNQWFTDHAIFSSRELVIDLLEYRSGYESLPQEAFALLSREKTGAELDTINQLKSDFLNLRKLSQLNLDLLMAQDQKNPDLEADIKGQIESLKAVALSPSKAKKKLSAVLYSSAFSHVRDVAFNAARNLLDQIGVNSPDKVLRSYPHELPLAVRQKVAIALALSVDPKILVLDEPTANLDANNRVKILSFLRETHRSRPELSILILSRDLTVLSPVCDRVLVLYAGNVVEEATSSDLIADSKHPFTTGIINTFRGTERITDKTAMVDFTVGFSPDLVDPPAGCRFHPRCKFRMDICSTAKPKLASIGENHNVACFLYAEEFEEER